MDWGIGHATRCVPIIRRLQKQEYEIILSSSGNGLEFFKNYFPELRFIENPLTTLLIRSISQWCSIDLLQITIHNQNCHQ
jgi:UDP:flavonoid glycosyltransferase YjiC (YdhE family)